MRILIGVLFLAIGFIANGQNLKISAIEFEGLKRTKASFLLSLMETTLGGELDSTVLYQDINQLVRLSSVAYASPVITEEGGLAKITIKVEENSTLIPSFNIWTQKNQVVFQVGLSEFNLGGKNATLGGFYQYNGKNVFGAFYKNPYLFSSKFGLAFSIQSWTSDEPLFFEEGAANFEYGNNSIELLGLYRFNYNHSLQLGINVFEESYTYLNEGVDVPENLHELSLNKQLFKFVYSYVDAVQFYFYKDGIENDYYLQAVNTQSEGQDSFFIFWNDFKCYQRIGDKGNWATRFRLGVSTNSDSPFAPFVLDNHVNIRGVGDRIERGTAALIMNTEYRYTLYDRKKYAIQGVGFVDAGTWRAPGGELVKDFTSKDFLELHAGVGVRLINKKIYSAILRLDYGQGILHKNDLGGFVVGIGQYF